MRTMHYLTYDLTPLCDSATEGFTATPVVAAVDCPTCLNTRQAQNTVARPRVPIRPAAGGRFAAHCQHCPWSMETTGTVKAEIVDYVRAHRHAHAEGRIDLPVARP